MGIRIGVDVGGTFTKAVGFDLERGEVVASAAVPTTHTAAEGPAAGVVQVVGEVARAVGPTNVDLVTHSTTQAVNALLEGDVETVGVLGLGRRPDLRKARRRTRLDDVELSPGRRLRTIGEFLDVTDGLDDRELEAALDRLQAAGATAVCVAEAFAPEGGHDEQHAAEVSAARGLPTCASGDMTGLYGLELRAVTAALNASILPIAVRTEEYVERGVRQVGISSPVMVMRGDGGATDPEGFRREPARTLYSGPAASVAGVLRFTRIVDGILVEVGGTSTNVAAIRGGKPALSYVQVASHATALRSLDVRVVGIAGGSMLRARKGRLYGVGPRSAHIAGLPYSCYLPADELEGATAELLAPRPGDPAEYVVVRLADGRLAAITNTCAAVALGIPQPGDAAAAGARADAALAALDAAGSMLRLPGVEVARRMLDASGRAIAEVISAVASDYDLSSPSLVAVGGGAGGLGRHVAASLGLACDVPHGAEVISSIGDALSLVRVERERTVSRPTADDSTALAAVVEAEAVAAGASVGSVEVRVDFEAERSTLRAVATGSVGLEAGALPGRPPVDSAEATRIAAELGYPPPRPVGSFWVAGTAHGEPFDGGVLDVGSPQGSDQPVLVLDRYGDVAVEGRGGVVVFPAPEAAGAPGDISGPADAVGALARRCTRRVGPVAIDASVWLAHGTSLVGVGASDPATAVRGLLRDGGPAAAVVVRG